ncbi:MAG: DUF1579 domain-containing protein [Ignavibacteriaceae bacterium]
MLKHICLFTIAFSLFIISNVFAQEGGEQSQEMQAWMEYMTPGPMHEMMAKTAGEWKVNTKYWMDPAGEPMETEGKANVEMILGGRYMKSTHTGTMMGMPFEGINLQGYDNATGEFTAIWIDNMGTGISVSKGKYDEATKSINFEGSMLDPMTKEDMSFRQVVKTIDDNHFMFEMYMNYNGQEFKSMVVDYSR